MHDQFYPVPENPRIERCRSCNAQIIWTWTGTGQSMPLSVRTIEARGADRVAQSHFVDCPQAAAWRRKPTGPLAGTEPQSTVVVVQESFL
jgi:hypothetical protein